MLTTSLLQGFNIFWEFFCTSIGLIRYFELDCVPSNGQNPPFTCLNIIFNYFILDLFCFCPKQVKVALRLTRSLATGFLNESTDGSINTKSSPQNKMAWQEIVQPMEIAFPNGTNQVGDLSRMKKFVKGIPCRANERRSVCKALDILIMLRKWLVIW